MEKNKRTIQQNKSLHLYLTKVAEELNAAGLERKITITMGADVPWSAETIKEVIWRSIQHAQTGKYSTAELTTKEYSEVWETVNRFIGENFGVHVPVQSYEDKIREHLKKELK